MGNGFKNRQCLQRYRKKIRYFGKVSRKKEQLKLLKLQTKQNIIYVMGNLVELVRPSVSLVLLSILLDKVWLQTITSPFG